jgi:probable HAF family extracellular repeat protein
MSALARLSGNATTAADINNLGQIVGSGATNPDGTNAHAVLWTN